MAEKAFEVAECVFLYLETGTRVGGGEETKAIDIPLQREVGTGSPLLPSSSFKGALRGRARAQQAPEEWLRLLGSAPESEERQASCIILSDALPLLFPVRSLVGVFAWVTSLEVWSRFRRDLERFGVKTTDLPAPPTLPPDTAGVAPDSPLLTANQTLVLEELSFPIQVCPELTALGEWLGQHAFPDEPAFELWRKRAAHSITLLPERAHRYFLQHSTQVSSRIRIDPLRGTAADGSLWNEEFLPPETLLYALVGIQFPEPREGDPAASVPAAFPKAADALGWVKGLAPNLLHIGSDHTLGKGLVRLRWTGKKPARAATGRKTKKT